MKETFSRWVMSRVLLLLLLVPAGCGRAEDWKNKYVAEVNAHYKTQQAKNKAIFERDLKVENLRHENEVLNDKVEFLEHEIEFLGRRMKLLERAAQLEGKKAKVEPAEGAPAPPATPVLGVAAQAKGIKVTAVATEIDLVVISAGREQGVKSNALLSITRGGEPVAKAVIDRLDRNWAAVKVKEKTRDPRVGDDVTVTHPK